MEVRTVFIFPHTHWDREWYEPEYRFRQRLVETVADLLEKLESNDDIRVFLLDGQTVIIDDYLSVHPHDEHRIRTLAHQGRLLLGPWYVLADEFLTTDETLVRNLLHGKARGDHYGNWMRVGYCPDSFGHPASLPTILRGFGIEWSIVWRGYGKAITDPDLFRWVAPDGATVLTHHLPPDGYEVGAELPVQSEALTQRWKKLRKTVFPRAVGGAILLPNGADHHGLQPDLPEAVRGLSRIEPGLDFRIASPEDFFEYVTPNSEHLSDVVGELRDSYGYTWTLQGVHSSRSRIKRLMSHAERLLVRWAEPHCALASMVGAPSRKNLLDDAWRMHLQSCAHDSFGGCCTDDVAEDVVRRATRAAESARALFGDAIGDRLQQDPVRVRRSPEAWESRLVVVNPSPFERSGIIEATVTFFEADMVVGKPGGANIDHALRTRSRAFQIRDENGESLPFQVVDRYLASDRLDSPRDYPDQDLVEAIRVQVRVGSIPALGCRAYRVVEDVDQQEGSGAEIPDKVRVVNHRIMTQHVGVAAGDRAFSIVSGAAKVSSVLDLVSEADIGDTYTFQPVVGDEALRAVWSPVRTIEAGPFIGCLARDFHVPERAVGTAFARVDSGSGVVRWVVEGNNLSGNHRLRVLFPLPAGGPDRCVADQHFGPVSRVRTEPAVPAYPHEHPVATAPCHRYVTVQGEPHGLTVFPRGVFEYEMTDANLAFTVLRAVGWLSRGDLAARPGHAAWPKATPEAQELGRFRVEFGSACCGVGEDGTPAEWSALERLAEEFHGPLTAMMFRRSVAVPDRVMGPTLSGPGVVFKTLKPADNGTGVVFRCANVSSAPTRAVLTWPHALAGAALVGLDESAKDALVLGTGNRTVQFEMEPREVISVRVWT